MPFVVLVKAAPGAGVEDDTPMMPSVAFDESMIAEAYALVGVVSAPGSHGTDRYGVVGSEVPKTFREVEASSTSEACARVTVEARLVAGDTAGEGEDDDGDGEYDRSVGLDSRDSFVMEPYTLSEGSYDVHFRVQDDKFEWSAIAILNLIITGEEIYLAPGPVAVIDSIRVTLSTRGGVEVFTVIFNGTSSYDSGGGTITDYEWYSNLDGMIGRTTEPSWARPATFLSAGSHEISLRVQSDRGGGDFVWSDFSAPITLVILE